MTSGLTYAIDSLIGINNLEVFKGKKQKHVEKRPGISEISIISINIEVFKY